MPVVTRGEREVSLRLDTFPGRARKRIEERIAALTAQLQARVEAAAPYLTGQLRSEIVERDFADNPNRVAGYVSVYAPGIPDAYAKAATLEYGTNKPRRSFQRTNGVIDRVGKARRRIVAKLSKPAHIEAFKYLRGPLAEMKPEIEASLNEALAETAAENPNG
jgi:hypothetical protein